MKTEAKISLSRAETFQDQDAVHEIFSELRKEDPVAWCPETEDGPGFWSITKYDDIQFVSKNPKLFSSDRVHGGITFLHRSLAVCVIFLEAKMYKISLKT